MDLPIGGATRDEIARILEQVAKEGLDHPRNIDAAIDAIGSAFEAEPIQRVTDMAGDVFFVDAEEDPAMAFGENNTLKGYFIAVDE